MLKKDKKIEAKDGKSGRIKIVRNSFKKTNTILFIHYFDWKSNKKIFCNKSVKLIMKAVLVYFDHHFLT